jgi:hypothetical protein
MPAPFGHVTVPPSTKNFEKYAGSFSGSNTGPSSHSRLSSGIDWSANRVLTRERAGFPQLADNDTLHRGRDGSSPVRTPCTQPQSARLVTLFPHASVFRVGREMRDA